MNEKTLGCVTGFSSDLGRGNTTEKPGALEWTVTSKI